MPGRLDRRAPFALTCGALSLLVVESAALGVFFGLWGGSFATATLMSRDTPMTKATRWIALIALVVTGVTFCAGVALVLTAPIGGE